MSGSLVVLQMTRINVYLLLLTVEFFLTEKSRILCPMVQVCEQLFSEHYRLLELIYTSTVANSNHCLLHCSCI